MYRFGGSCRYCFIVLGRAPFFAPAAKGAGGGAGQIIHLINHHIVLIILKYVCHSKFLVFSSLPHAKLPSDPTNFQIKEDKAFMHLVAGHNLLAYLWQCAHQVVGLESGLRGIYRDPLPFQRWEPQKKDVLQMIFMVFGGYLPLQKAYCS